MQIPSNVTAPVSVRSDASAPDGSATFTSYSRALMAAPGVTSAGWGITRPDAISLNLQTAELAMLADRVFADTVEGVRLLISTPDSRDVAPDSWVRNSTNVVRAMSALPGVVEWSRFGGYTLLADTRERVEWLRKVVSADVDGTPVHIMLREDLP